MYPMGFGRFCWRSNASHTMSLEAEHVDGHQKIAIFMEFKFNLAFAQVDALLFSWTMAGN